MIEFDLRDLDEGEAGHLLTGLVVPRPIAWVSTVSIEGVPNLAPHSYFMAVSSQPPILMFASTVRSGRRKDTLANVEETGEFVVNLVSEDHLEAMNMTSASVEPGVDEFELAGLAKAPSRLVRPWCVKAARAAMECRMVKTVSMGDATVVFGEVVYVHIDENIWLDGRVDATPLRPLSRLGGSLYGTLGTILRKKRPD